MAGKIWLGLGLAGAVAGAALAAPAVDGAVEARLRALEKRVSELEQRAAPEDLERRVSALERKIGAGATQPAVAADHSLEQRVTTLERKSAAPVSAGAATTAPPPAPAAPARWTDSKNWAALRVGMTWSQVKQLLGVPGKVKAGVFGDVMYFPDADGGSVEFDRDGRVAKWSRPGR